MRRPDLIALAVAILVALVTATAVHAGPTAKAPRAATPAGPCDFAHRMDLEIIDGVWHECVCTALVNGWDCDWRELPAPVVASRKKTHKPLKHRRLIPVLVVRVAA